MDATTLPATWQEALEKHSVANVKVFEKQLRGNALRDKEKLRVLVGSNYRDLLATAEQIIELNDKNHNAEVGISALSQACKSPSELDQDAGPPNTAVAASQIKLTDRFLRCASKAVKERSVLLAAKLVIIARLLLKHLEQEHGTSKTIEWLTTRLKNGRQHLLKCIDAIFVRPTTPSSRLVQAAGAYCLTTSSSSADVVRHFRALRAQRLAQGPSADELTKPQLRNDLKQRCHYFVASVAAIKMLSGRGVVDLLNSLQKHPVLEDQKLLTIEILQLDTVGKLLPADIMSFTPYFKRTVPVASELRASTQQWVNEASKHLLISIGRTIQNYPLRSVIKIRQIVLDILLPSCFSTLSHEIITTSIREEFSTRIVNLIQQQAQTLQSLGSDISSIIQSSQPPDKSIWQSNSPRKLTAQPPPSAIRDIRQSHLGVSNDLTSYFDKFSTWLLECRRTKQQIESLSKIRWQDKIEEFDEEDEDVAQELVSSLSKNDPIAYLKTFDEAANSAADAFITNISDLASQLATTATMNTTNLKMEPDNDTTKTSTASTSSHITTLLRITRESTHILTSLIPTKNLSTLHTATSTLHQSLAQRTATNLWESLNSSRLTTIKSPIYIPSDLPSPLTILLLETLCTTMSTIGGTDIWTTAATAKVKQVVLSRVTDQNGELKARYIKSEIDEAYLGLALGVERDRERDGEGQIQTDAQRRAATYWSRTKLLFGVLNP